MTASCNPPASTGDINPPRAAELAEQGNIPADFFYLTKARIEILAVAGLPDTFAVCLARDEANARTRALLDPSIFAVEVFAVPPGEPWPSEARRKTTIVSTAAGDTVLWLYTEFDLARAALAMVAARGGMVVR